MHFCFTCYLQMETYSRTSVAQTLMVRLPWLFRTLSWVPWKKFHSCRFWIVYSDFLFYTENGILCVLVRIALSRQLNENTQHTFILKKIKKIFLLCLLTWHNEKHSLARTTPVSNIFSWFQRCLSNSFLKFYCKYNISVVGVSVGGIKFRQVFWWARTGKTPSSREFLWIKSIF